MRLTRAALESFREFGYARTAVEQICRRAGVAVGTFYANFQGKADLLEQKATSDFALYFTADELGDVSATERVLRDFLRTDRGVLWGAWREAVLIEPALVTKDEEITREVQKRLVDAIADARIKAGLPPAHKELPEIAWAIRALVREALRRATERPDDVEGVMARTIHLLVHSQRPMSGVAAQPTRSR